MSMRIDQDDGKPEECHAVNVATDRHDATFGVIVDTRSELQRWLFSGTVVLMAYAALATVVIHWHEFDDPDDPAAALVIDLAPMPVAPTNMQSDVQPEPEVEPQKQVEHLEELEEKPEIVPEVKSEFEIPKPVPETRPPPPEETPVTPPPQAPTVGEAPVAAAPSQGRLSTSNSNAVPAWKRQVVNLLERNKRYPAVARQRGERGTTEISFSLDRQGRVVSSRIVRSSGSAALDQATLDLVSRVQPFPVPPSEMAGIELTVPIRFMMN